jgi:radical SAM superfamily enzyme YgiQ (UPF0313 family)
MAKKIILIQPKTPENFWTLQKFIDLMHKRGNFPPISLATVAALTPSFYEVVIIDENIEKIDFGMGCDLVGITGYTVHAQRMFEIASEFRKRGVLTVGGGVYCSSHLEQCLAHFDVVLRGEAEKIWPEFLMDWERGEFQRCYVEENLIDLKISPQPRWDLSPVDRYLSGIVQSSRGCPNDCEFCDVTVLFGRKCRYKRIDQVMQEINWFVDHGAIEIFLADDNFIGNKNYAKEILRHLITLNEKQKKPIAFFTQVTVTVAEDDELLRLFREAGFVALFIGIESPKKESLKIANKKTNLQLDLREAVRKIQAHGIMVYSGMVVGFDTDDLAIFGEQEQFLIEAGIMVPMIGMLVAAKDTKLWKRLEKEGRLVPDSEFGDQERATNFIPLLMTKTELEKNYFKLIKKVHSSDHFLSRYRSFISQIDLKLIRPDSILEKYMDIRNFRLPLFLWTLRVLKNYLFSADKTRRKLFFAVMRPTVSKSIFCLPLALNSLAYFLSLDDYVNRSFGFPTGCQGQERADSAISITAYPHT